MSGGLTPIMDTGIAFKAPGISLRWLSLWKSDNTLRGSGAQAQRRTDEGWPRSDGIFQGCRAAGSAHDLWFAFIASDLGPLFL